MIYSIVGTHVGGRTKALAELEKLGAVSRHLYSEHIEELESLIDAQSLFGETLIFGCNSLLENPSSKEIAITLLPGMEASPVIFIIDEPFADAHKVTRLTKVSKKLYDVREEKKRDNSVFTLCDAFAARDKKVTWTVWMTVRDTNEGEAIAGALWWKWQSLWSGVRSGKRSPYTVLECEKIGAELLRSTILAHRGEVDLKKELERILLSI